MTSPPVERRRSQRLANRAANSCGEFFGIPPKAESSGGYDKMAEDKWTQRRMRHINRRYGTLRQTKSDETDSQSSYDITILHERDSVAKMAFDGLRKLINRRSFKSKKTAPVPPTVIRQLSKNNNSKAQTDNESGPTCDTPTTVETVISQPIFPKEMKHYSAQTDKSECAQLLNNDTSDKIAMDYQSEQEQELEALEAIYPSELEILNKEYPKIEFSINLSIDDEENTDPELPSSSLSCSLEVVFPENYPETIPDISLCGLDEQFGDERRSKLEDLLRKDAQDNIGMALVFTLVSSLQEHMEELVNELKGRKTEFEEREKREIEEEERKKMEGTRVTVENFVAWKKKFDEEIRIMKKKQEKLVAANRKPTGKEQFQQDATLSISDIGLIQEDSVQIDESLFDDLDDLDIEDDVD